MNAPATAPEAGCAASTERPPDALEFAASAALFRALADPHRLKVLSLLARPPEAECATPGRLCACDLEAHLGLSQPTVSHHMRLLVQSGLVTASRRGKWTEYALAPARFAELEGVLAAFSGVSRSPFISR